MKFTNALVIAALLATDMQGASAIRRHHHHHRPHFVQLDKSNEDILK